MSQSYPHLFAPGQVGPMRVKNRVVLTPHGHLVSSLWGSDAVFTPQGFDWGSTAPFALLELATHADKLADLPSPGQ